MLLDTYFTVWITLLFPKCASKMHLWGSYLIVTIENKLIVQNNNCTDGYMHCCLAHYLNTWIKISSSLRACVHISKSLVPLMACTLSCFNAVWQWSWQKCCVRTYFFYFLQALHANWAIIIMKSNKCLTSTWKMLTCVAILTILFVKGNKHKAFAGQCLSYYLQ